MIDTNWELIVERYHKHIGDIYEDDDGTRYRLFGLVHGDDDYYYGLTNMKTGKLMLYSCVGALEFKKIGEFL
jgi:hypothetical protein